MPIKIKLSFLKWINFFKVSIIIFAVSFAFLDQFVTLSFSEEYSLNKYSYLFTFLFLILLSFYLFAIKNRNLIFKAFKISASSLAFKTAYTVTAKELNGEIKIMDNSVVLIRRTNFHNTDCLMKFYKTEDIIYITNYSFFKHFSKKKDKELFNVFLKNINSTLNNESPEEARMIREQKKEEQFWNEKEWTLSRSIKRLLIYSFLLPINLLLPYYIYLILMNERDLEWEYFSPMFGVVLISYLYFKSDIFILMEKRKRKNKK